MILHSKPLIGTRSSSYYAHTSASKFISVKGYSTLQQRFRRKKFRKLNKERYFIDSGYCIATYNENMFNMRIMQLHLLKKNVSDDYKHVINDLIRKYTDLAIMLENHMFNR